MKAAVALALSLIPAIGATAGAPVHFDLFGHFDNVVSNDQGEHCGGYSLDLWNADGRLIGLLHEHSGLCGDPPCAVIDSAMFDASTRRLQFKTVIGSRRFAFAGSVRGQLVSGTLNGRPIRLKREEASRADTFEPDTNARAWCTFWESVPRCTGVKELCSTLR
jgi:hypothetical protein